MFRSDATIISVGNQPDRPAEAVVDQTTRPAIRGAPGTAGLVSFRWAAYCDGEPRLGLQVKWYATEAMRPAEAAGKGDDYWAIEIQGRPCVRLLVELAGTLDGDRVHPDNPTNVSMLATAIPAIQSIPDVVAAPPGVLVAGGPRFHWKAPDAVAVH